MDNRTEIKIALAEAAITEHYKLDGLNSTHSFLTFLVSQNYKIKVWTNLVSGEQPLHGFQTPTLSETVHEREKECLSLFSSSYKDTNFIMSSPTPITLRPLLQTPSQRELELQHMDWGEQTVIHKKQNSVRQPHTFGWMFFQYNKAPSRFKNTSEAWGALRLHRRSTRRTRATSQELSWTPELQMPKLTTGGKWVSRSNNHKELKSSHTHNEQGDAFFLRNSKKETCWCLDFSPVGPQSQQLDTSRDSEVINVNHWCWNTFLWWP